MQEYLDNPHWAKLYKYAMGPPNGGYYKRWIQGSVGMMEPMPLWSNEYSHTYMKHGQDNIVPYRGGIKSFAPSVTSSLRRQVHRCTLDTINPGGCQDAAIRKVYSVDASPHHRDQHSTISTPHPFEASYRTGYSPSMQWIPPNGRSD